MIVASNLEVTDVITTYHFHTIYGESAVKEVSLVTGVIKNTFYELSGHVFAGKMTVRGVYISDTLPDLLQQFGNILKPFSVADYKIKKIDFREYTLHGVIPHTWDSYSKSGELHIDYCTKN